MDFSRSFLLAALLLTMAAAFCEAAPPKVDFFFPPGGRQGQTATVTISGNISNWPLAAWVDREGLTIDAGEKRGELKITAAPDAAGVYWVRLYDSEGAATLRPFVVGGIPEAAENEPNDDPHKPQVLEAPATVSGKLARRGDVDTFSIGLKAGQTLVASLMANNVLSSPMDGVLQVCNSDGFVLAQYDDARGLDPLLVYTAPSDGTYLVRTFAFPAEPNSAIAFAGGENFVYRLTITSGPFVNFSLPLAVRGDESTELRLCGWNLPSETFVFAAPGAQGDRAFVLPPESATALELEVLNQGLVVAAAGSAPESPQSVELPVTVSGVIESPGDIDAFRFAAKKGQKLSLRVESRSLGFEMDPIVQVSDGEGKMLAEADDTDRQRDPVLAFAAPADGEFQAVVRDLHFHGGPRHAYRLAIEEEVGDYHLTLAADSFTLTPGKPLEIPVTIERQNGFSGEIEISPQNLPAGVTAAPVKSLPSGDTAKSVKLTLTAETGPGSGPISILGRSGEDATLTRSAQFTIPGSSATHTQAWLTVSEK